MYLARLLSFVLVLLTALASTALAQGPLTSGVPAQGQIDSQLEEDIWTFAGVSVGDTLILAVKNLATSGFNPEFYLTGPTQFDSLYITVSFSGIARMQVHEAGTFQLKAKAALFTGAPGGYQVQVLKVPGTITVPAGDQGGALTEGVQVTGQIPAADPDPFTLTLCAGATPRILLSEVPPNPANQFSPAVWLFNSGGTLVHSSVSTTVVDTTPLPLPAGAYTLVAYGGNSNNTNSGDYTLTVTGMCGSTPPPVGNSDTYSTSVNTPLTVAAPGVLGNDTSPGGSALSATLGVAPQHGAVTLAANGSFTYTPTSGYTGSDTFTYFPINANGTGNQTSVFLTVNAPAQVQPPTNLFAASINGSTITLQWTPPTSGPAPTGYVLDGGLAPGDTIASLPTGSTNPVLTFNAPAGVFYLRVRSLNGAQSSTASNEIVAYVNVSAPPSAPANLLGMANGQAVALAWRNTFGGGAPTGITLDVSGTLSGSLPVGLTDLFTYASLPAGTYTFSVRATNVSGASAPSNPVTLSFPSACTGVPQTPANFLAYAQGSLLNLSWTPAAAGAAPTSYTLDVSGAVNLTVGVGAARSISGNVGPGSYTVRVSASNACGTSAYTTPQTVTVP